MVIAASISLNVPTNAAFPNCIDAMEKIIAAIIRMRTAARPASVWRIRFNANSIRNVYRGEFSFCAQLRYAVINSTNFFYHNCSASRQYKCNGHRECSDGSDEDDCSIDCQYDEFQCAQHDCILLKHVCGKVNPKCAHSILITNQTFQF